MSAKILRSFLDLSIEQKSGYNIEDLLKGIVWDKEAIDLLEVGLTPDDVIKALDGCYLPRGAAQVGSGKYHHYPDPARYRGLHGGAVIGHVQSIEEGIMAFKLVHRRDLDLPGNAPSVDVWILLSAMRIHDPKVYMNFTDGSGWRTAWFGWFFTSVIKKPGQKLNITIKGPGDITGRYLQLCAALHGDAIGTMRLISKGGVSNYKMVEAFAERVPWNLEATQDDAVINPKDTDFLITNADGEKGEEGKKIVSYAQAKGIKYIWSNGAYDQTYHIAEHVIKSGGYIIGDGFQEMVSRDADPASNYINKFNIDWEGGPHKRQFVTMAQIQSSKKLELEIRHSQTPKLFVPVGTGDVDIILGIYKKDKIARALADQGFEHHKDTSL